MWHFDLAYTSFLEWFTVFTALGYVAFLPYNTFRGFAIIVMTCRVQIMMPAPAYPHTEGGISSIVKLP
jgi:hypothetical protein